MNGAVDQVDSGDVGTGGGDVVSGGGEDDDDDVTAPVASVEDTTIGHSRDGYSADIELADAAGEEDMVDGAAFSGLRCVVRNSLSATKIVLIFRRFRYVSDSDNVACQLLEDEAAGKITIVTKVGIKISNFKN
jgi:hypothetical protein